MSGEMVTDKQVVSARHPTTRKKQRKSERTHRLGLEVDQRVGWVSRLAGVYSYNQLCIHS